MHLELRSGHLHGSLIDILDRASPVLLISVGMTLVIATGGVDLSVGAVLAIAGAVAATLISRPAGCPLAFMNLHGWLLAIVVIAALAALACGLFNGLLVSIFNIPPIVATLLLMVAGRGVAQLLANGQIVTFENPGFAAIGRGALLGIPTPFWIFLATVGAVALFSRLTAFGLFVEATGSNRVGAHYVGINTRAVVFAVYAICGLCAGLAGLILTADIQAADANNAGLYLELDAILAVCVGGNSLFGGRFSLLGTTIGALLMQAITTTILMHGISPPATMVLKALVVFVVCLLQSPEVPRTRLARWVQALRRPA